MEERWTENPVVPGSAPGRSNKRGCSSVGRALALQARCPEFESPQLHFYARVAKLRYTRNVEGVVSSDMPVRIWLRAQVNSMDYAKLFEVIFQGKFWIEDKWELRYLEKVIEWAEPVTKEDVIKAMNAVRASFKGKIAKKYLNKILVLAKASGASGRKSGVYYVLFPGSVWTQKSKDLNVYTAGSIEPDSNVPGRTSIVLGTTGEIRQSDAYR